MHFVEHCLEKSSAPFLLVMGDSDDSFPSETGTTEQMLKLMNHPHVIHIFAQNCDYAQWCDRLKIPNMFRVSPIPIGVDFHTISFKPGHPLFTGHSPLQQSQQLHDIYTQSRPTPERLARCFVDFQLLDSLAARQQGETRTSIFQQIKTSGVVDWGEKMPRAELWQTKSRYAFSVSPHGRGLDCHRTWEDLLLGCIVIVKTSVLDPMYEGLPVVIVNQWSEITADNLNRWQLQFSDASSNPRYRMKLTNQYWYQQILKKAKT
jgi:hypothetical protein